VADKLGPDLIGNQDHPVPTALPRSWTLLSFIGAATERIRLFPDVAALPLRPPAVLAEAAASLDLLTRGHLELRLGAGAFLGTDRRHGRTHRSKRKSVAVLSEACVSARPSAIASTNWARL